MALSTLRPATSPCLSTIPLDFVYMPVYRPVETLVEKMGNDLRWATDEFNWIEREFEGGVKLTVIRGPGYETLLDTLNVRFCFRGADGIALIRFHSRFPTDPPAVRSLRWGLWSPHSIVR